MLKTNKQTNKQINKIISRAVLQQMSLAPGNCALNFYSGYPFFVGLQGNDFHVVFAGARSPMSKYIARDEVLD